MWLGAGGAELAPLLPDVPPLSLKRVGKKPDPQEFESTSISLVGRIRNRRCIRYQDGTIECCELNHQGQKEGLFALYYPSLPHLEQTFSKLGSHFLQQKGFFYQGLPCGPFELYNEHGVCVCKGCYELMEAGPYDQSQNINLQLLQKFIKANQQEDALSEMLFPAERLNRAFRYARRQKMMPIRLDYIVVRYGVLSHRLLHGQIHTFEVGPEHPAILLKRHANETWLEACTRAHQRVLRLVQTQVNELKQAQRAAAELLNQDEVASTNCDQELDEIKAQLASPCYEDDLGGRVHLRCLEKLGQLQPEPIVSNCERGGYAPEVLDCFTRTADGHYLNGILVSSAEYYERQSYRRRVEQTNGAQSDTIAQDNTALAVLRLAHFIEHQQNEESRAPDLDQVEMPNDVLCWVNALFAPALTDDKPYTEYALKRWGELQLTDIALEAPQTNSASTQAYCDPKSSLGHLTSYVKQYYDACKQSSDLASCGLHWGHYFYCARRCTLSNVKDTSFRALPIWAHWDIIPISIDTSISLLNDGFNWHAAGLTSWYDTTGSLIGHVGYNHFGRCDGTFELHNEATATSVYGQLKVGQLQPTLTFTIYQDYRTKFPAATLTVDLEQDSFIGPYHTIYGIDELFEKGYHAVMLEDWGMIMTEAGLKPFKRLIAYTPGTYLKEEGVYQADGAVQVTKKT